MTTLGLTRMPVPPPSITACRSSRTSSDLPAPFSPSTNSRSPRFSSSLPMWKSAAPSGRRTVTSAIPISTFAWVPLLASRTAAFFSRCAGRKLSSIASARCVSRFETLSARSLPLLMPMFFRSEALRRRLHQWREQIGAQMPVPNPEFDEALRRRLYVEQDPSRLTAERTATLTQSDWQEWRKAMTAAIQGRRPSVTPAQGDVRLFAKDARLHSTKMRYEPEPHKNVLGYWTNVEDWAEWTFDVPAAGVYEVEVQQGCGAGSGGNPGL